MRRVVLVIIVVVIPCLATSASDIEGKVTGWVHTPHPHSAVIWLEGIETQSASKIQPVMAQHGGQFVPSFLVVQVGQTVSMPNEDEVAHNVYSFSPAKQFDLGFYAKGDPKTVTFDRVGLVDVLCLIHHFMRAKILVVPNGYYAMVAADGSFRIRNAPAGTIRLMFWADGMTTYSQEVMVREGSNSVVVNISLPDSAFGRQ